MAQQNGQNEQSPLLGQARRLSRLQHDQEADSMVKSHVTIEEHAMGGSTVGERLAYNDYTTIDWLHDLVRLEASRPDKIALTLTKVKDSYRCRFVHSRKGFRYRLVALFDSASGWVAAAVIGILTACVAFLVDIAAATVSDWKTGYCTRNPLLNREACCEGKTPLFGTTAETGADCTDYKEWSSDYASAFVIYVAFALAFGVISGSVTMLTKRSLPAASLGSGDKNQSNAPAQPTISGKSMYMAAGSGIPEIKTILSGFVIPNFLDFKVLVVKAVGAVFAVSTGMCLGKEGPFVHISTCVGYLVASCFPKYRDNGRKMRGKLEMMNQTFAVLTTDQKCFRPLVRLD